MKTKFYEMSNKQGTVVAKRESKKFCNLCNNCAEKTFLNRSQIIHVCLEKLIRNNFIIDYIIEKNYISLFLRLMDLRKFCGNYFCGW